MEIEKKPFTSELCQLCKSHSLNGDPPSKKIIYTKLNYFFLSQKITCADFLFQKSVLIQKSFSTTFKMGTPLTNAYTSLDQKSKLLKTNSIAIGTKELYTPKKNLCQKTFFIFSQNGILKSL